MMNCALCLVHGEVPNPASTVLNGHAVCRDHIQDVVAAPGAQGVTVSRMRAERACATCDHHERLHEGTCSAGVGGGELCGCTHFTPKEGINGYRQKAQA